MLRVDKVEFWNNGRVYSIFGSQIENFPFIGGTPANVVTTKVWNQHGNTFVESYMEPDDAEFTFIIPLHNVNRYEVEGLRKEITDICNPLNGTTQMKVFLNNESIYNRDIVFSVAPSFPTGTENRNREWQRVLLQYTAHNPFWYSENEIVESFEAITPLLIFPFTMSVSTPLLMGRILPNNIATNEGQVPAPVTIRIVGACTNPRIDNLTTGEYIKFNNLTMVANDVLEITTAFGEKKVLLNGVNVFNKLDFGSTFFNLKVGENEINFTDTSGSKTAAIHFIYRNLFITV